MAKLMYFGTESYMSWIPCPAINATANTVRWRASSTFLNGGASQRQSTAGHKEYSFSWNPQSKESIYAMLAYFDGTYGDGPFYFLDPVTMDANVLPSWFAAPFAATKDGPSWVVGERPAVSNTGANALGYPTRSAQYTVAPSKTYAPVRIPVPSGYELHVGVHGNATGTAAVSLVPASNPTSPTNVSMLSTSSPTRTSVTVSGGDFYSLVPTGTGDLIITGIIAQVLPTGSTVASGNFIAGQGNSGVRLSGDPQVTEYSAVLTNASVGATVSLVETGAWE